MEASEILKMESPGELFLDPARIKEDYKELIKKWHPDVGGNSDVFVRIKSLYEKAIKCGDLWISKDRVIIRKTAFKFRKMHTFELGKMFLGKKTILFLIDAKYGSLVSNAIAKTSVFNFSNDKMKWDIDKYLPHDMKIIDTNCEGHIVISLSMREDLVLLRDVLSYYSNNLLDRHIAWIIGTMYNAACYLQFSNLSHNAISEDTYFISPSQHNGALLGGWWYCTELSKPLKQIPSYAYATMTPKMKSDKLATSHIDLNLIRSLGLKMMGDRKEPVPMYQWFKGASCGSATEEYSRWENVLTESFGPRKFVEMAITPSMVY